MSPLTLTLSLREREQIEHDLPFSLAFGERVQIEHGLLFSLSFGERAGVRGNKAYHTYPLNTLPEPAPGAVFSTQTRP
ncbi:hypothetical protein SAMN04487773_4124 [Enterobacter sp. kpr-6]|nr:hypothetical protein SAMN04487773_4124 [Enterobacter sp. kpr-6]